VQEENEYGKYRYNNCEEEEREGNLREIYEEEK
jgi:hypothetical protein